MPLTGLPGGCRGSREANDASFRGRVRHGRSGEQLADSRSGVCRATAAAACSETQRPSDAVCRRKEVLRRSQRDAGVQQPSFAFGRGTVDAGNAAGGVDARRPSSDAAWLMR